MNQLRGRSRLPSFAAAGAFDCGGADGSLDWIDAEGALDLGGGCPSAAVLAVKGKVPVTGWPSAEATRQATVYLPDGIAGDCRYAPLNGAGRSGDHNLDADGEGPLVQDQNHRVRWTGDGFPGRRCRRDQVVVGRCGGGRQLHFSQRTSQDARH